MVAVKDHREDESHTPPAIPLVRVRSRRRRHRVRCRSLLTAEKGFSEQRHVVLSLRQRAVTAQSGENRRPPDLKDPEHSYDRSSDSPKATDATSLATITRHARAGFKKSVADL